MAKQPWSLNFRRMGARPCAEHPREQTPPNVYNGRARTSLPRLADLGADRRQYSRLSLRHVGDTIASSSRRRCGLAQDVLLQRYGVLKRLLG